jgi:tRNA(Ile)-lysidine synthase
MLDLTRAEILDYLEAREVTWVEDETNADESRLRNRIRRRVLPVIEECSGGDAGALIASGAERVGALLEVLDTEVRNAELKFISETGAGETLIRPLGAAAGLAQAVRAGLWRAALDRSQGQPGENRGRHSLGRLISGIDALVTAGGPSGQIDLPGGLVARRVYDALVIGPSPKPRAVSIVAVSLALPGRTRHVALDVELLAALGEDGVRPVVDEGFQEVSLDADRLGEKAFLRSRLEGDRFQPAGAPGGRKLKAFLIDRKIPRAERDFIPLVAVGKEIAWVVGHAVSEQYRAGANTRRVISLRADRTKRESGEN